MKITVESLGLPTLSAAIGKKTEIALEAGTVADLVRHLTGRFGPKARQVLLDGDGNLDLTIQVMLNEELRSRLQAEHTDDDEIALIRDALVEEMRVRAETEANKAKKLQEVVFKREAELTAIADEKKAVMLIPLIVTPVRIQLTLVAIPIEIRSLNIAIQSFV